MSLSSPFIRRPVGTTLLTLAVALAGGLAFTLLPVSSLPRVEFPTILVSAALPGADPETMASAVATPLERQFGRIAGVAEMTSTSTLGSTTIVLQFDLDRDIDGAARDVQAAINAARSQLPSNLPANPNYWKVNPSEAPILILALTSTLYDAARLYDAASSVLQPRFAQVRGVGQIFVGGGALPAVRVEVDPGSLNGLGLTLSDVRAALAAANANRPKGQLADDARSWSIAATDQWLEAREYRSLVLAMRGGAAVRLADVATVTDSVEDLRATALWNGKRAVILILFRQPGANVLQTVERIQGILPQLRAEIPAEMDLSVVVDRTPPIRASVADVEFALAVSIALVILVVFLFLRNVRTAVIPSVAVPVSLIGAFGVLLLGGYSIDNLSLMALAIATGFVVDDAIVVIENITRHIERGMTPREAAFQGAREIGFTVLSMSTSLIAVFTPILLMGGIVGRLFREFAVTLSAAVAVSLVVSLTTTPMMCAMILRPHGRERHGRLYRASERIFQGLLRGYAVTLAGVLRHPRSTLAVLLATVALTGVLLVFIPKGFFPEQDTGRLIGSIQADQDISFQAMARLLEAYARRVGGDPAVEGVVAVTGGRGSTNTGTMYVTLKPPAERRAGVEAVMARIRRQTAQVPGAALILQPQQDLRVGGRLTSAQYQFTLEAGNLADLTAWAPRVLRALQALPGLIDVTSDQQDRGLRAWLAVDRDTAGRLGLSMRAIDDALYDAFGQRQVSTMYRPLNQYHVVMEAAPRFTRDPGGLRTAYLRGASGALVPLGSVADHAPDTAPLAVNHSGLFPSVTLSFNLKPGVALGDAVRAIERAEREIGLPATIHGRFAGTAQAFQASLADEPLLIAVALLAVYIVLGVLYESLIHPVTILSTLPSAGVGALLALLLFRAELTVIALIGIILLIGIVKKNAILMIDFALDAERREGKTPEAAITQACLLRFRPILMTTLAALLGGLPLALGTGMGSELRRPLGLAIVGGLIVSQLQTLYTTPVVYLYLDRFRLWSRRAILGAATPKPTGTSDARR